MGGEIPGSGGEMGDVRVGGPDWELTGGSEGEADGGSARCSHGSRDGVGVGLKAPFTPYGAINPPAVRSEAR